MRVVVAIACGVLAGCHITATFTCEDSAQCGAGGTCEPDNLCSFPDPVCASGRRYGDYSGELSGECVGGASVTVGFQFATSLTDERAGTHMISIVAGSPATTPITISVEVTGGSADANDFALLTPTVTIDPGETRADIDLAIVDDGVDEPDETIELRLTGATGAALAGDTHVATISSHFLPRIAFVDPTSSDLEGATGPRMLALALDIPSPTDVVVAYGVSGTATSADHDLVAGMMTIPAGMVSAALPADIVDDAMDEYDETIDVTLSAVSGVVVGAIPTHSHTIVDDDPEPSIGFTVAASTGDEAAGGVAIQVTLDPPSGKPVAVDWMASGGTASAGDYTLGAGPVMLDPGVTTATFTIAPINDATDEDDETVGLRLANPTNATIGFESSHTFTITDDDPAPTLQFDMATAAMPENAGTFQVMVSLSAASERQVSFMAPINFGSAGPGDVTAPGGVYNIPPGATSAAVQVNVMNDSLDEGDEMFSLVLTAVINATVGAPSTFTGTILDDDVGVHFVTPSMAANEGTGGGTTLYNYDVSLTAAAPSTVTVNIQVSGSANGIDRSVAPNTLTFSPGTLTQTVVVTVAHDNNNENDETVILTLINATNAEITSPSSVTHTILNDD